MKAIITFSTFNPQEHDYDRVQAVGSNHYLHIRALYCSGDHTEQTLANVARAERRTGERHLGTIVLDPD